jgi:acetyl-CoA C-acetyltransferase
MKSVSLAAQAIACGAASVAVAGGMESMSRAPHLVRGLRGGLRLGGGALEDSLLVDGLTCAVGRGGPHMGALADAVATASKVTRAAMDAHALESHARAAAAAAGARDADRAHGAEVVPVLAPPPLGARTGGKPTLIIDDDAPAKLAAARVPHLPPAFSPGGCITAATSSPVSDGAAALVLASSTAAAAAGSRVLAHIVATADAAVPPHLYPHAPAAAARRALARAGLAVADVDLWEINEAFSVVALVAAAELGVDAARVNAAGGAVALGHPIGATGAALVARLAHELAARGGRVGVAAICNGGGGATAVVLRRTPPE